MPPSTDQRDKSRRLANEIRDALAQTRIAIRSLGVDEARDMAAAVVRDPGPLVGSMRAGTLIAALPLVGRDSPLVTRVLRHIGIGYETRLRDLTDRQRDVFATALVKPKREQLRLQPETDQLGHELAAMRRRHERAVAVLRSARGADVRLAERVLRELAA